MVDFLCFFSGTLIGISLVLMEDTLVEEVEEMAQQDHPPAEVLHVEATAKAGDNIMHLKVSIPHLLSRDHLPVCLLLRPVTTVTKN